MLAPMAGYTTSAYRSLVREIAPAALLCTELVSVEGLVRRGEKTLRLTRSRPNEQPLLIQLFGHSPASFAEAARVAESLGFTGINLNMGCPARKVVRNDSGSAFILQPRAAFAAVEAVARATRLPVSVKTRLGYADSAELLSFARGLVDAGASLLIIHGRTVQQEHRGAADWEPIHVVQEQLAIPVLGNGGVTDFADGIQKQRNLAGFAIGRAALGNPWALCPTPPEVTPALRAATVLRHLALLAEDEGERRAVMQFRSWLPHYLAGWPGAKELRSALAQATTLAAYHAALQPGN